MHDLVLTRWGGLKETYGARESLTWDSFVEQLSRPTTFSTSGLTRDEKHGKWNKPAGLGGYSLATFRGDHRAKSDVETVFGLTLDYDDGETTVEEAATLWRGMRGVILSSFNSTREHPRFRVHVLLSRAVTGEEYERVWTWANERATSAGQTLDPQPKDPSRFWYMPSIVEGESYEFVQL